MILADEVKGDGTQHEIICTKCLDWKVTQQSKRGSSRIENNSCLTRKFLDRLRTKNRLDMDVNDPEDMYLGVNTAIQLYLMNLFATRNLGVFILNFETIASFVVW